MPQFYGTSASTYEEEAKNIKQGEGGDYFDKWPGNTDGSPANYLLRIGPSMTPDGKFARQCLKFFVPKNLADPSSEKEVFIWPEGSEQTLGQCPLLDALSQLKQMGVADSLLEDFEPQECFYTEGWMRDETFMNVNRTKPQWINLKKSMYNQLVQFVGNQQKLYGDLFDPYQGWDVLIVRSGTGRFGTKYQVSIVPCSWTGTKGPVHPDPAVAQQMLQQMKPLTDQFPLPSNEDLGRMNAAAQRLIDHYSRLGAAAYAATGAQVPAATPGAPAWPQSQPAAAPGFPAAAPPAAAPGVAPVGQPPAAAAPGAAPPAAVAPPAAGMPVGAVPGQPTPGMPPAAGQPGMPPQAAAPPGAVPGQPVAGQPPFEQGTTGESAGQSVPEQSEGGAATSATPKHTLESAKSLAPVWNLQPEWIVSVNDDGYWCTAQIPAEAGLGHDGEWYYSLVEDAAKKGPNKGYPKLWKTDSTRGMRRHITGLLKKRGETPPAATTTAGGNGQAAETPPPEPVAEPGLPSPEQTAAAPPQAAAPAAPPAAVPPAEAPAPAAAVPQPTELPPGPTPGTQTEQSGGLPPQCYFDPNRLQETGYFVVSAANPMTCMTCPWEEPCKAAANEAAAGAPAATAVQG